MKIRYELTKKDLWQFQIYALLANKVLRNVWLFLLFVQIVFSFYPLFKVLYFLLSNGVPDDPHLNTYLLALAGSCAFDFLFNIFFTATVTIVLTAVHVAISIASHKENDGSLGNHVIELDEDYLREITDVNDNQHSWKSIGKIAETKRLLLIYISSSNVHIIPKRTFATREKEREFIGEVQRLKENAQTRFSPSYLASAD